MPAEPTVIEKARSAEAIAARYIKPYHPHLIEAKILYLFTSKAMNSRGKTIAAKAYKFGDRERFLSSFIDNSEESAGVDAGYDFLMLISRPVWDAVSEPIHRYIVDHELSHFGRKYNEQTEEWSWTLRAHDVEDFASVIARHGLVTPDLNEMYAAMRGAPQAVEVGHAEADESD